MLGGEAVRHPFSLNLFNSPSIILSKSGTRKGLVITSSKPSDMKCATCSCLAFAVTAINGT